MSKKLVPAALMIAFLLVSSSFAPVPIGPLSRRSDPRRERPGRLVSEVERGGRDGRIKENRKILTKNRPRRWPREIPRGSTPGDTRFEVWLPLATLEGA